MSTVTLASQRTFDPAPWAACLVAGLAAGALGGICARVAMRVVILFLGGIPGFSLEGSIGVVVGSAIGTVIIAIPYTILHKYSRWPTRTKAMCLAAVLLALALWPLFAVARGDLPNASPAEITRLLLLFVWIPPAVGVAIAYGARWLEPRLAVQIRPLPLIPALVLAGAYGFTCINLLSQAMTNPRHPVLVWTLVSASRVDFTQARDDVLLYGLLVALGWCVLSAFALWRNAGAAQGTRSGILLMAVGGLLMAAGAALPQLLSWLPNTPWMLGLVQSLGLAALLALLLTAAGAATSRASRIGVGLLGAAAALWLLLGQPGASGRTEWIVWGTLALAFALATLARVRAQGDGARVVTLLLALFAALWLLLWAVILVTPGLNLAGLSAFAVTLTVPLFWLPWLLLPAALLAR